MTPRRGQPPDDQPDWWPTFVVGTSRVEWDALGDEVDVVEEGEGAPCA